MCQQIGRPWAAFLSLVFLLGLFSSCGEAVETAHLDIHAFSSKVEQNSGLPEMTPVSLKKMPTYFPKLDPSILKEFYFSVEATTSVADEFAVFLVKDPASVETVRAAIEDHKKALIVRVESYNPSQVPRIKNALTIVKGNYILFVISDNNTKVEDMFVDAVKKSS